VIPKSLGSMAAHIVLDTTKFSKGLTHVQQKLTTFRQNLRSSGLLNIAIGVGIAAPLLKAVGTFRKFDDQMRLTKAVTGAVGEEFAALSEKAKYLGRTTSYTASQVAAAMVELGRAGFAVQEIEAAIGPLLNMARATGTDLAEAAGIASSSLRAFVLDASKMGEVADVMTAAANSSAQTLTDLGESMKYAAPVAAEFGMTLQETAKAIATMANFSIRGSMAGTSLRMVMLRIANKEVQNKLRALGVQVEDSGGKLKNVSEILQSLGRRIKELPRLKRLEIMGEMFGARAISGGLKLAVANFDKLNRAIDEAAGTAARTAREMDAGIGGALRRMWAAVEGTAIATGMSLTPAVSRLAESLEGALDPVTRFIKYNRWLVESVAAVGAGFLAWGASLLVANGAIWVVVKSIKALRMAIAGLNAAMAFMAANPMYLVLAAIVAVAAAAGYAIYKLTGYTAKLVTVSGQLLDQGDKERRVDLLRLKRLKQLSEKRKLSADEIKEAQMLNEKLANKYGDLGIEIDAVAGSISGMADAYKRATTAMREMISVRLDEEIATHYRNIAELQKEIDSVWLRTGRIEALAAKQQEAYDRIIALRKRQSALLGGDTGALTGPGAPAADLQTRINQEEAAQARIADVVQRWHDKVQQLAIAGERDGLDKQIALITQRYDVERRMAEGNERALALIRTAQGLEYQNAIRRKQEEVERRLENLRIAGIKDDLKRTLAAIDLKYKREMKGLGVRNALREKLERAWELERANAEKRAVRQVGLRMGMADKAAAVQKGTVEAYTAVVGKSDEIAKKTEKNTEQQVAQQKKTNVLLESISTNIAFPVFDMGGPTIQAASALP